MNANVLSLTLRSFASIPSQALNVIVKSALPLYSASYAAVSSVAVLNVPVPPSAMITAWSSGTSWGSPNPAYSLPSRSFGRVIVPSSRTAISVAVWASRAMTDRSFAPAAIAKVAPSWVLIPQSAAPDETRISGLVLAYGTIRRSIAWSA